ncbi:PQQ-dependent sugar dehydrogenase [Agrococcus jejuensis]|uniref:Glucose/arabinose dehydrogenase, beta-propeller fold n=1 Tax=Agrococcus jejuensis TaxID=399736 RepID=A0A1G8BEL9_9MICO|nr:PQQ-dependent sugar dehydrogenase [Agrococcus jejuensis]SDH31667.1 Glucose/arabinose dehydrogenase, beta-propeller fold [Agrococcus jejuensis]
MTLTRRTMLTGMLGAGLGLTACAPTDPTVHASGDEEADAVATTPAATPPAFPTVDRTIATGLAVPWSLAFLADGAALVSERATGRVLRVDGSGGVDEVGVVPGVAPQGEGGLLGLALSPDESALYAYLSSEADNRLVRMPFHGGLGTPEVLVEGIALARNHQGGRLRFGPDGMLYVTVGDAADGSRSQDPNDLAGKILRLDADGQAAEGNPFGTRVWSLGHRNPQGLAWDGDRMWAAEFGQDTADELNRIEPGGNYGWPAVEGAGGDPAYVDPIVTWPTSECSPSGLEIDRGVAYLCALRGQGLWVIPLAGDGAGTPQKAFDRELGRLRCVALAPDGSLWVTTSNRDANGTPGTDDDRILRVAI